VGRQSERETGRGEGRKEGVSSINRQMTAK